MSLSSNALSEGPMGWIEAKDKKPKKVPPSRQMAVTPDEKVVPETR